MVRGRGYITSKGISVVEYKTTLLPFEREQPLSCYATGFKMYAVGVGNAVEGELKEIASEPTGEHYFYTADFKTMTQIAKKLQINICQGKTCLLFTDEGCMIWSKKQINIFFNSFHFHPPKIL